MAPLGPREEPLEPGLPVVDTHHHLWDGAAGRYLADDVVADIAATGRAVTQTVFVECLSHYRDTGPAAMRPVGETAFAAAQGEQADADGRPGVAAGIVGHADLRLGDGVGDVLDAHLEAGRGRFRGVRFATSWDASPEIANSHTGAVPHLLTDADVGRGLAQLEARGLSLDAWLFFGQLADVAVVADRHPGLTIVLDHCGGPLGHGPYATRRDEHFATWRAGIADVARRPNVVCKIGGILGRGAAFDYLHAPTPPGSPDLAAIWRPWFHTCLEEFDADRCLAESNFPVEKMGVGYGVLWNTLVRTVADASPDERHAVLAGTARRVYRLPEIDTTITSGAAMTADDPFGPGVHRVARRRPAPGRHRRRGPRLPRHWTPLSA